MPFKFSVKTSYGEYTGPKVYATRTAAFKAGKKNANGRPFYTFPTGGETSWALEA